MEGMNLAKLFKMFDYTSPGPGVRKDEPEKTGIARFFDILGRRFWNMVSLNALYLLFSIIPLVLMWLLSTLAVSFFFSQLPQSLLAEEGMGQFVFMLSIFLALAYYSLIGGGAPTAALTYVVRNYTLDRHAWVWSDFIDCFKKNIRQATIVFVIDIVASLLFIINFYFYFNIVQQGFFIYILQGLLTVLFLLFLLIHLYVYPLLVTFDLKIWQIYKNSFLLLMLKLPRAFGAFLASAAVMLVILGAGFVFSPFFLFLVPIIMFALMQYIALSISFPVVKKYMIDLPGHSMEGEEEPTGEAVFDDTEPRRTDE